MCMAFVFLFLLIFIFDASTSFFFECYLDHRDLHSFPTRRSSDLEPGKEVVAQSGCLACHKLGDNGNDGPGPELTHIGARVPRNAIARSLEVGPSIMPSYAGLPPQKFQALTAFLASLN